MTIQSIPLTFRAMFHQYFQMGSRIHKHYLSPRVFLCLLSGKFVPPINRKKLYSLQYSMLPARRASIRDMWEAVSAPSPSSTAKRLQQSFPALANGGRRHQGPGGGGRARYNH